MVQIVSLRQVRESSVEYSSPITTPDLLYEMLQPMLQQLAEERLIVVCLDPQNKPTLIQTVAIGSANSAGTCPREVFKLAILSNATTIVLAHNHPSGSLTASPDDLEMTVALVQAGKHLGIEIFDHLIISDEGYRSMRVLGIGGLT